MLVPAKPKVPTEEHGYAQLTELIQRQRLLVDQIDASSPEAAGSDRNKVILQELNKTLQEMERLAPLLQTKQPV